MKIAVFGLGYVGAVSAACLAKEGHTVVGVDPNETKVDLINAGRSPIIETDVGEIIAQAVGDGRLRAVTDAASAIADCDLSLVCVGTPSAANGSLDLRYVELVCQEIGAALKAKPDYHTVVIRSTILPGTMRSIIIPALEGSSGLSAGQDFGLCNNPEFLREGTAVYDYHNPPKTVIGGVDERSTTALEALYAGLPGPKITTRIETAEMVKYVDNVWHALKVTFANEIGAICKPLDVDSHTVMDIFCQDRKLNISPYYLKPGFAFGGSCLPKDVRALTYRARQLDLSQPLLNALMPSNALQVQYALDRILGYGKRRIALLGLSFKSGTDDLRESPLVELAERLIGKGYELKIYDANVHYARIHGSNRDYIESRIPHLSSLLVDDMQAVIDHGEIIVLGNSEPAFQALVEHPPEGKRVFDLVGFMPSASSDSLEGVCW